jgi:hypothetical protein
MPKFRKKPMVIEAIQLTEEQAVLCLCDKQPIFGKHMVSGTYHPEKRTCSHAYANIQTLEGLMRADMGDWIIKGVNGELYPCKPDIFDKTYEPVEGQQMSKQDGMTATDRARELLELRSKATQGEWAEAQGCIQGRESEVFSAALPERMKDGIGACLAAFGDVGAYDEVESISNMKFTVAAANHVEEVCEALLSAEAKVAALAELVEKAYSQGYTAGKYGEKRQTFYCSGARGELARILGAEETEC